MFSRVLPILVTGAFLTGCATNPGPKPDDQLASAQSALQSAANAGGEDTEPSMVAAAREKVATAESSLPRSSMARHVDCWSRPRWTPAWPRPGRDPEGT